MSENEAYEILIIGSGEAAKYLAWTKPKAGYRVAVVERQLIGGACPNIACLPSINVIYSAKVASARRGAEFGLETGPIVINMASVQRRKRLMVEGLTGLLANVPRRGRRRLSSPAHQRHEGALRLVGFGKPLTLTQTKENNA
jgi:pyruvate/2-oxoglutarate dehydrogenase complex dihydrolipoamide dehydrogenase (E3) component